MRYSAPLFVLLALTTPTLASAQGDSIAMAAIARLKPGNTIRVHALGQGWLNGFPTASLDSVLVRHTHAGTGAALGALVGMLVGALIGAIIGGAMPSWEHRVPVEQPRDAPSPVTDH